MLQLLYSFLVLLLATNMLVDYNPGHSNNWYNKNRCTGIYLKS